MGYSSEAIFIKSAVPEEQFPDLLAAIGFSDLHFNKKATFEEADRRGKTGIYIGNYNGSTILIYDDMLSDHRGKDNLMEVERALVSFLPHHEILSIVNVESANAYLYHYIVNGKTRRLKYGASGVFPENEGEELPEEKNYYVRKEYRNKNEYYFTKSYSDENTLDEWTHDQVGGSIAFSLAAMFVRENYSSIPLELELNQYLTSDLINQFKNIPAPEGRNNAGWYFNKKVIAADFLPLLESRIVPLLANEGFDRGSDPLMFRRTLGEVEQTFSLEVEQTFSLGFTHAGVLMELNPIYRVKTSSLKKWVKEKYGLETFSSGTALDERQPALRYENQKQLPTLESKTIGISEFTGLLEYYIINNVLPFFKTFATPEGFAQYSWYRGFRADFYYMLNRPEEAREQLVLLSKEIRKENNPEKYYNDIEVRLKYGFPEQTLEDLFGKIQIDGYVLSTKAIESLLTAWKNGWELMQNDGIFTPDLRYLDSEGTLRIVVMDEENPEALNEHYKTLIPAPVFAVLQHSGDVIIDNKLTRSLISRIKIGEQIDTVRILPIKEKVKFDDPYTIPEVKALSLKEAAQKVAYIFQPLFGNKRITIMPKNDEMAPVIKKINDAKSEADWKAIEPDINSSNVNQRDGSGQTYLHRAIYNAPVWFVEYLLKTGADPNITNFRYGRTPAYYANDVAKHKLLIAHGLNVNHQDDSGWTAAQYELHVKDVLKTYVDHGLDLSLRDLDGRTIAFEVWNKSGDLRMLADRGADLNAQDNWGLTLMHVAILSYDYQTVEFLKQRGVNLQLKTTKKYGDVEEEGALIVPENTTARELVSIMKDWRTSLKPGSWQEENAANTAERFDRIWILIVEGKSSVPLTAKSEALLNDYINKKEKPQANVTTKEAQPAEEQKLSSPFGCLLLVVGLFLVVISFFTPIKFGGIGLILIIVSFFVRRAARNKKT